MYFQQLAGRRRDGATVDQVLRARGSHSRRDAACDPAERLDDAQAGRALTQGRERLHGGGRAEGGSRGA
eukprot:scaffold112035_cov108-Phaeocystis_antarctica.AAC.1